MLSQAGSAIASSRAGASMSAAPSTSASASSEGARSRLPPEGHLSSLAGTAAAATVTAARAVECREDSPPPRRFHFFTRGGGGPGEVVLREGMSTLENTGWRLWRGSYTCARYLERDRPSPSDWDGLSVLDLSCGVGLCGLALCQVCADVTLTELPENIEVVRRNIAENFAAGGVWRCKAPVVVPHAWGAALPPELQRNFDLVVCNDLLYEVFHRKLHVEFHATLRDLVVQQRQAACAGRGAGPRLLFCYQVRATPQERRILNETGSRLELREEEMDITLLAQGMEGTDERHCQQRPRLRLVFLKT